MYDIKALYEAKSIEEAIELKIKHSDAIIIAGGSDILIQIREGELANAELISIHGINELNGVNLDEKENIIIGSLTTFSQISNNNIIQQYINVLGQAANKIGSPQIRNIATIGGNICNGVTSADSSSTLHAWDAILELKGKNSSRRIPIEKFYLDAQKVDIKKDEILTSIIIPKNSYDNTYGYYFKYSTRKAMDIATLGCSVNVKLTDDKKTIERVRLAFGVAGPIPLRAKTAESAVTGLPVCSETVELFGNSIIKDIKPRDSWRASKAFREYIAIEITKRAFTKAIKLAGGEI